MAIKEITAVTINTKELKSFVGKAIVYDSSGKIITECNMQSNTVLKTPKENTIIYGTDKEITTEIDRLKLEPIVLKEITK